MSSANSAHQPHLPPTDEEIDAIKQKALELLPKLRQELGDECDESVPDEQLLHFLYWKQDVGRAKERFHKLREWTKQNPWGFNKGVMLEDDPTLQRCLESEILAAPDNMYDKFGRPVIVGRLRYNDMSDGRQPEDVVRTLVYVLDRVLEREEARTKGILLFHDLRGLSLNNIDIRIPKMLIHAIIGHFPFRVGNVYALDAPVFFRAIFNVVSLLIPAKLRQRIHFVSDISEVPIETSEMLVEHGGQCNHNQAEWVQKQIQREKDGTMTSLSDCYST